MVLEAHGIDLAVRGLGLATQNLGLDLKTKFWPDVEAQILGLGLAVPDLGLAPYGLVNIAGHPR